MPARLRQLTGIAMQFNPYFGAFRSATVRQFQDEMGNPIIRMRQTIQPAVKETAIKVPNSDT